MTLIVEIDELGFSNFGSVGMRYRDCSESDRNILVMIILGEYLRNIIIFSDQ